MFPCVFRYAFCIWLKFLTFKHNMWTANGSLPFSLWSAVLWIAVTDPRFPRRETTLDFGTKTYYLARFFPKTAWKWNKLDRERGVPGVCPSWIRQWVGTQIVWVCSGGSKGGRGGRAPPPWGSKFFQFHAVFGKIWQNRMLAPPPGELAPPPQGNPRSATDYGIVTNSDVILTLSMVLL